MVTNLADSKRASERESKCSGKSLLTRICCCTANQAGIQLFTPADLLSIEIGCLPRKMR